jgi:hypothetical protein
MVIDSAPRQGAHVEGHAMFTHTTRVLICLLAAIAPRIALAQYPNVRVSIPASTDPEGTIAITPSIAEPVAGVT